MLQNVITDIIKQMLDNQLRKMEEDKTLERIIYAEKQPRVEHKILI